MRKRIIGLVLAILGIGAGYTFLPELWKLFNVKYQWLQNSLVNAIIGLILMLIVGAFLIVPIEKFIIRIETSLVKQKPEIIVSTTLSMTVGLIIAVMVSSILFKSQIFFISTILPIVLMIIFTYLGYVVGKERLSNLRRLLFRPKKTEEGEVLLRKVGDNFHRYKLLDTNILIDGRIYDLAKIGFIEGTLVVPNFVLYELQYIADSAESIKRVRGRRGLDILNKLRSEKIIPVKMYDGDFEDIKEVDSKLIKLAKVLDAVIVTNDYNLNKVCEFQNVEVLNINALAKAIKPRVLPGEKLNVMVIKNGTERQQGVAYLDDGTMIVVEDGRYYLNKSIEVIVTSTIQTDAGRMIFAKPTHSKRELAEKN